MSDEVKEVKPIVILKCGHPNTFTHLLVTTAALTVLKTLGPQVFPYIRTLQDNMLPVFDLMFEQFGVVQPEMDNPFKDEPVKDFSNDPNLD